MPRIADSDLQRLKEEVSVQRLIEASGIELKRVGKDVAGRCPFHDDDTASLIVTPAKNLWHCFGCGLGGGPVDWVMKRRGVSFRHAVELLKEESALAVLPDAPVKQTSVRSLPPPVTLDADDHALMGQVIDYYHQSLKDSPDGLAYLAARGLAHPELIAHFQLGLANRTLGLRLPQKNRVAGAELRAKLERLGIYRSSGHEHFNGSLVVPVFDEAGHVVEVYGRKLRDDLRAGTPKHLYLPTREGGRGVFNLPALKASQEIILCEAILDALTFWCAGYRNVTTAYGIEGFTDELLEAFKAHQTKRVLIAFDRDEAGERGAAKVAEQLMAIGIDCWRVQFPKGMDANEYALKVQPAAKSLGVLIRKAEWLGQGRPPARPVAALAADVPAPTEPPPEPEPPSPAPVAAEPEPLPVSPLPASPLSEAAQAPWVEVVPAPAGRDGGQEVHIRLGEGAQARAWRVRGLHKNLSPDVLKVNLRLAIASAQGGAFHVDTLDLYNARQRGHYIAEAARETAVDERTLKADLGRILMELEVVQDQALRTVLQPEPVPAMDVADEAAALALLRTPELPARIVADFIACGVVGETTNCLVGYLASISRKLDRPLAVVIQSSSAAGKSSLMDAVLAFVPEEERVQYSAMTGQSLFYMGQTNLKHKILAIAEEEGAHRASYALKLLQSEGELTIASTGTDPQTGNLITQEYRVEGPMSLFMTTTAIDIDEELMNRCLVLSVNEAREQTRAIHQQQRARRTLAGLQARHERQALIALHGNAQRLLKPLAVVNPWADQLTFLDDRTRTRRDHEKYLTLIDAIALLHQHQRKVKTATIAGQAVEYIEATREDIALANRLAHEVLGTSLDELPPQTRRVLAGVHALVRQKMQAEKMPQRDVRFTRAELRQASGAGDTQLKIHLARLSELEYLLVHRVPRGQGFEYELLHDAARIEAAAPHLSGLIDVEHLKAKPEHPYDSQRSGTNRPLSAPGRAAVGGQSAQGRAAQSAAKAHAASVLTETTKDEGTARATPGPTARRSYPHASALSAA